MDFNIKISPRSLNELKRLIQNIRHWIGMPDHAGFAWNATLSYDPELKVQFLPPYPTFIPTDLTIAFILGNLI